MSNVAYPADPNAVGRAMFDARLHLLDRQVLDVHDVPVTAVDDVELGDPSTDGPLPLDEPAPEVTNLISGLSLGTRLFGGRPPTNRLHRIECGVRDRGRHPSRRRRRHTGRHLERALGPRPDHRQDTGRSS